MPHRFLIILQRACLIPGMLLLHSCSEPQEETTRELGFETFVPKYNNYIKQWLSKEKKGLSQNLDKLQSKLAQTHNQQQKKIEAQIENTQREIQRIEFRQSLGDYFSFKSPEDLPTNLTWEDGLDQPEIGDNRATKGGVFRFYMTEFPPTVRPFGKEANNSFRGRLYDELEVHFTGIHPITNQPTPGLAKRWAISPDGRTVYYELDPDASYNNGRKVSPRDFMIGIYIRVSDNVSSPYEKQFFREQFAQITTYGETHISVTLPEPKPMLTYYSRLQPADPLFYQDYGPDYVDHYQWKVAPHTGAYYVREKDIHKGVSIQLTRKKDWWAKDKKFYRNLYNPDKIRYTTIRDESKAFELFRAGQLDAFYLTKPNFWYEKSEIEPVFNGYIERYMFYTQFPRSPRGIYMNVQRPLLRNLDTRIGIAHALNWQKVIDVIYRGDYARLQQFSEGFSDLTNPAIKARSFSVTKARQYFKKAGYTKENSNGILQKPNGELLAINVTYPNSGNFSRVVAVLKEEARKAGLELRADGQEPTVAYKKVMKKEHDATLWSWGMRPPFPSYHQFFHSENAIDALGQAKPQTNNINGYAGEAMDGYCQKIRNARTVEEVKTNAWKIQEIIRDDAIFSPGWVTDFVRIGSWRWVRWPDTPNTPFNTPVIADPLESYVLWIDEKRQQETHLARRNQETFPEVQKVIDTFKSGIPKARASNTSHVMHSRK